VNPETAILLALALPLVGAAFVGLFGARPNLRETSTLVAALATFIVVASLVPEILAGERPYVSVVEILPGIRLAFEVEPLGLLFALVASGLWIVTSVYSIGYMRGHHERNQTRFYACFAIAIFAALGVALAQNMLTLFVFYEVLTLSTYPLVTHHQNEKAKLGGRTYLGILLSTSIGFLLLAVVITWNLAGTLDFREGGILAGNASEGMVALLLVLYAFGTGKAALMPFHRWLPAAMVAPTPVSALLHAVAVVKAGVFTVMKVVVYIFGIDFLAATGVNILLMYMAGATILFASLIALTKDNLKARLAYSTISQLSYIVLGAALANHWGVIGGSMHIVMMPITTFAFLIGSLSIIGLPPMGGAWSKWYLALGAAETHQVVFVGVLMVSSLLNIAYLLPVVVRGFFFAPPDGPERPRMQEAPLLCVIPLCVTATGCLVLFFYAEQIYRMLLPIAGGP